MKSQYPSLDQIREPAAQERAGWSDAEYYRRAGMRVDDLPVYQLSELEDK